MTLDRDQVLAAALAELNRHPTATMAELASAIGIGRATLHRHFSSREALLAEMAERSLDHWDATHASVDLEAVTASGDAARIEAALHAMIVEFVGEADEFGFLLTDAWTAELPELQDRVELLVERELRFFAAAQAAGLLRSDLPVRWIGNVIYGFMVAARDSLRRGDVARRDLDALVATTFLEGVKA